MGYICVNFCWKVGFWLEGDLMAGVRLLLEILWGGGGRGSPWVLSQVRSMSVLFLYLHC